MKSSDLGGVVGLASRLDCEPVASLLARPDWAWALAQRPGLDRVELSRATLRVRSAGSAGHAIVFLIDPPNTVEHYDALTEILARRVRVLCVELPGFGFSTPRSRVKKCLAQPRVRHELRSAQRGRVDRARI